MSRLTERELSVRGSVGYNKCYFTKCNALCSECEVQEEVAKKLKDYEDLEEQGLLLKLPCKVGDTLYRPLRDLDDVIRVKEIIVIVVSVYLETDKELNAYIVGHIAGTNIGQSADFSEFGKNIFLTKEEAEAKLKELKNE